MGRERLKQYSLLGEASELAVSSGLASADWFRSDVDRATMKRLMRRTDGPAVRDLAIWLGTMVASAIVAILLWPTWWSAPFLLVYGLLYASASEARRHETGHGTAFKSRRLTTIVYQLSSFLTMREPDVWRWQHTRHHTDTLIVGRDPEIEVMRPARLARVLSNFLGLVDVPRAFYLMALHSCGVLTREEKVFIPATEQKRVYATARLWLLIYAATVAVAFASRSLLPIFLIGGPRIYGSFLLQIYGLTQHTGMGENVIDHRLNTRTVHMNRLNRFMYWNMNYHVEHHMFPMVPYHKLPELHQEVKRDLASAYSSIWVAYKEIIPAVFRQLRDQEYYIKRELPPTAVPYREIAASSQA